MSGVATSDFFSSSPQFAAQAGALLLRLAGAEPAAAAARVHDQLAAAPLERLLRANSQLLDLYGLTTFVPVVESPHPGQSLQHTRITLTPMYGVPTRRHRTYVDPSPSHGPSRRLGMRTVPTCTGLFHVFRLLDSLQRSFPSYICFTSLHLTNRYST